MRTPAALALVILFAAGCTQAVEAMPTDTAPELDAGGDVLPTPDAMSPPDSAPPAADARVEAGKADTGTVDTGTTVDATDAGAKVDTGSTPEASPPPVEAGVDAGTDAGGDSAPTVDAAPPSSDGAPSTDATDAGTTVDPVCSSPMPACQRAIETDDLIRATFPQPCAPEGDRKCGGVWRGVVETLPMICRDGRWRLAGSWSGVQWAPLYTCSAGCGAAGKICTP